MVPGTKYQDAKRPGHGLSLPPIVLAAICLGRQISRRQMSQRLMSRSQKSWPGNVPGAKSPNANCPKRQMSAGKCLSADGELPFVSLPIKGKPFLRASTRILLSRSCEAFWVLTWLTSLNRFRKHHTIQSMCLQKISERMLVLEGPFDFSFKVQKVSACISFGFPKRHCSSSWRATLVLQSTFLRIFYNNTIIHCWV